MELAGLISKSSFVIANDTGPAHMAAHLGKMGIVLFGHHTTPKKVSIETDKFKAIISDKLENLTAEKVYQEIEEKIKLIN
jgi:ADP-heptose:LPS heptosyltransferase